MYIRNILLTKGYVDDMALRVLGYDRYFGNGQYASLIHAFLVARYCV